MHLKHIVTLTANPALDKTTSVDALVADKKLRCTDPQVDPGGGGINVSRAIKKLGGDSTALYLAGGPTGILLTELLDKEGVRFQKLPAKGWTRENIMVVDEATNTQYRFNLPGHALSEQEYEMLLVELETMIPKPDFIVASGSLAPGMPVTFYSEVARIAKKVGAKLILDTSGDALKAAAEIGVYLLKPNYLELCELLGTDTDEITDVKILAREVIQKGFCEVAVVSMGAKGAMLVTEHDIIYQSAPSVPKRSTVGAGDSLVAGITLSLAQGKTLTEALKYGVACGTSATMNYGTELCKASDVEKLLKIM